MIGWIRSLASPASLLAFALAGVGVVVLFVAVFPTRALLQQRADAETIERDLRELEGDNAELDARLEYLESDDGIEQLARSEYGLVAPGESVYAVMPSAERVQLDIWPFATDTP